ncbi:unnamed protein product, partial [Pneumocystis jirovecii]
ILTKCGNKYFRKIFSDLIYLGHIFCKSCITQWLSEHRTCPSCKTETKRKDCYNIAYNDSKMNNKYEESNVYFLNYEDSKEKCSKINNEMFLEIKNIKLKKSYGAKVDMIIKHLLWIRKRNPSTPKSVIFSQWKEMLDILQHAFNNNGIKYTRLDKITANYKKKTMENDPVEKFKNDHSVHY